MVETEEQLDLFSLIKKIILSNSVISSKFKGSDFYQFEPKLKDATVTLPYIVIPIPNTSSELITFKHTHVPKEFTIDIVICLDYLANSKLVSYCNEIISVLETNELQFNAIGYDKLRVDLTDTGKEIKNQKEVVSATISLSFIGIIEK